MPSEENQAQYRKNSNTEVSEDTNKRKDTKWKSS